MTDHHGSPYMIDINWCHEINNDTHDEFDLYRGGQFIDRYTRARYSSVYRAAHLHFFHKNQLFDSEKHACIYCKTGLRLSVKTIKSKRRFYHRHTNLKQARSLNCPRLLPGNPLPPPPPPPTPKSLASPPPTPKDLGEFSADVKRKLKTVFGPAATDEDWMQLYTFNDHKILFVPVKNRYRRRDIEPELNRFRANGISIVLIGESTPFDEIDLQAQASETHLALITTNTPTRPLKWSYMLYSYSQTDHRIHHTGPQSSQLEATEFLNGWPVKQRVLSSRVNAEACYYDEECRRRTAKEEEPNRRLKQEMERKAPQADDDQLRQERAQKSSDLEKILQQRLEEESKGKQQYSARLPRHEFRRTDANEIPSNEGTDQGNNNLKEPELINEEELRRDAEEWLQTPEGQATQKYFASKPKYHRPR